MHLVMFYNILEFLQLHFEALNLQFTQHNL